jgi:hypothetical protein
MLIIHTLYLVSKFNINVSNAFLLGKMENKIKWKGGWNQREMVSNEIKNRK